MRFHIITLFPGMFDAYLSESIMARAIAAGKISVSIVNPRDFTKDKHHKADAKPYGGGPGMVMLAEPILRAAKKIIGRKKNVKVFITSPRGKEFTNRKAITLAKKYKDIIIIAGHYEGIDERVRKALKAQNISIGSFVLSGGELPALVMVDAIARQLPGVLGNAASLEDERDENGEVYTRPEVITFGGKNYKVPKVLLSGDHKKIEAWRKNGA